MPTLKEIREKSKQAFKHKYWLNVGLFGIICLILTLWSLTPAPYTSAAYIAIFLIGTVLSLGSLNLGLKLAKSAPISLDTAFSPFGKYGRNLGGSLWLYLFVCLWSLIAIIPYLIAGFAAVFDYLINNYFLYYNLDSYYDFYELAEELINVMAVPIIIFIAALAVIVIIKILQYFCALYILLDCPNVPATKTLDLSKVMMKGYKLKAFGLILSIAWPYIAIVAAGTVFYTISSINYVFGIDYAASYGFEIAGLILNVAGIAVYVLYYLPYVQTASAMFYYSVKDRAIEDGRLTYADFGELPPLNSPQQAFIDLN